MFSRFDTRARKAMVLAREESEGAAIDTAHLLCGIIGAGGAAAAALEAAGVDVESVRELRPAPDPAVSGPLSSELRLCLERALTDALAAGDETVGTTHLLAAALADPDSAASVVVGALGLDVAELAGPGRGKRRRARESREERPRRLLETLGSDLTEAAAEGRLDPVVGRESEIESVLITLCRRSKPNPVLLGEPGVGKTAVVEGVAQRIADGAVPEELGDVRIISLDMGSLMAGTRMRGDLEERAKKILAEASEAGDVLFIDEIHTLVGAGATRDGGVDLGQILKPVLARGELRVIGATTHDEYKAMLKDKALERRFTPVVVAPLSGEAAVAAATSAAGLLEEHHRVRYLPEAVRAAVELAAEHITERHLPDSAIDVLDEAGAAAALRRGGGDAQTQELGREEIAAVVAEITGIDVRSVTAARAEWLGLLETELATRVVGQGEAVAAVAGAARRAGAGLGDPARPVASFLFTGPSGVGKTLTAKLLAKAFFGNEGAITQFDMSEYPEAHDVSRLLGAPPGYVGYDEGGRLVEAIRRRRAQVLLFDEVEKADPKIFDVLLSLLEEGRVRGGDGRVADARGCVVVLTSNLGGAALRRDGVGFTGVGGGSAHRNREAQDALARFFRPEMLNRVDTTVVFNPLGAEELTAIARIEIAEIVARAAARGTKVVVDEEVAGAVAARAAREGGARAVRRAAETSVEDPLVEVLLSGQCRGSAVRVSLDGGGQVVVGLDPVHEPAEVVA